MTQAHMPVPPEEYEYEGEDAGRPLRAMEACSLVMEEMGIAKTLYFDSLHILVEPHMKRRYGPKSTTQTILKGELMALINEWKHDGF